jgi:sucrose phosphorylase
VYYVGLLAGENDVENMKDTGDGREINRHNFSIADIEAALRKGVVQRLLKLIRFRNEYPAFNGDFAVLDSTEQALKLQWQYNACKCCLSVDLEINRSVITTTDADGHVTEYIV